MTLVTVHQAKTHLYKLLARVQEGEEVVIAKGKKPVARLVPFDSPKPRRPGVLKGKVALTPAFFEPLPEDESAAWGDDRDSFSTLMR